MNPHRPGKRGPIPGTHEKRTRLVGFYLTPTDYIALDDMRTKGGFKSVSSVVTAIVEPLIQDRLSVMSAVRSITRIQRFMTERGGRFDASLKDVRDGMLNLFTPPPPIIPDDDDPEKAAEYLSQLKADLRALLAELENPTQPDNTK